jgi:endonuclease/exonuclease/phosphatase family metal-dependent hydrolase
MKILSYNTLFGGFDGAAKTRYDLLVEVIREVRPDVLLAQELKGYLANGERHALQFERDIGMRSFLAAAPHTGQNTGIFIRPEIEPLSFEADSVHFHHAASFLEARVPGFTKPVTFVSVHLCPFSPHVRLSEVGYLTNLAAPDGLVVIGGDFNSVIPGDPEPDFAALPSHFRARYTGVDGHSDRRALEQLIHAGFRDSAAGFAERANPTVPAAAFVGTEFVPFRSDYLLASAALAERVTNYRVVRSTATDHASDHYPILVRTRTAD